MQTESNTNTVPNNPFAGNPADFLEKLILGLVSYQANLTDADREFHAFAKALANNDAAIVEKILSTLSLENLLPKGDRVDLNSLSPRELINLFFKPVTLLQADTPRNIKNILQAGFPVDILADMFKNHKQAHPQAYRALVRLLPLIPGEVATDNYSLKHNLQAVFKQYYLLHTFETLKANIQYLTSDRMPLQGKLILGMMLAALAASSSEQLENSKSLALNQRIPYILQHPLITFWLNSGFFLNLEFKKTWQNNNKINLALKLARFPLFSYVLQPILTNLLVTPLLKNNDASSVNASITMASIVLSTLAVASLAYSLLLHPAIDFALELRKILEREDFDYAAARAEIPAVIDARFGQPAALIFRQRAADVKVNDIHEVPNQGHRAVPRA
jgi:hypothetical protein